MPAQGDTGLGGAQKNFPDTSWGMLSRLRADDPAARRPGLESLCARYWKPVYFYLRATWAKSNEDAKDLTQAFLLWLLEGRALQGYSPERASFRTYVKLLLESFVRAENRAGHALKRGGGARVVALDDVGEMEKLAVGPSAADPGKTFDRAWAMTLAEHAIERVGRHFRASGREAEFSAYVAYDMAPTGNKPTHADIAAKLGISATTVQHYLAAVRTAVRDEIRAELAQVTLDESHLEEEWNVLFKG